MRQRACIMRRVAALVAASMAGLAGGAALAGSYPQVGGGPAHLGVAATAGPATLDTPRFLLDEGIEWANQAGLAVGLGKVVGLAADFPGVGPAVVAVHEKTGQVAWRAPVPAPALDSWAWPAIDEDSRSAVVVSGTTLLALDIDTGQERWRKTALSGKQFVNASPTIADGVVYVPDFGTFSTLYAVHIATGQLLWEVPAGNVRGANTVAVLGGEVLLATSAGRFVTFRRDTGAVDTDVLIDSTGFFGGVAAEPGAAYAATYDFYAGSKLYKIDPDTGAVIWSKPAPRTDALPVVTAGLVIVSGGDGYWGDVPGTYAYDKATGAALWNTPLAGGWTVIPVVAGNLLYVPAFGALWNGSPGDETYVFDLTKTPSDPGFVVDTTIHIGSSPVVANGNLYGTGWDGLAAFGPQPRLIGDVDGDGEVSVLDIVAVVTAFGRTPADEGWNADCDIDGDGEISVLDVVTVVTNFGATG